MLDQGASAEAEKPKLPIPIILNPLLTDHDYCSPNKRKPDRNQKPSDIDESKAQPQSPLLAPEIDSNNSLTTITKQSVASASASTHSDRKSNKISRYHDDEAANLSDSSSASSSSSSSLSSGASRKALVIAQGSSNTNEAQDKSVTDVSAPVKRRPGRPSKKDMAENMKKAAATNINRAKRPRQNTSVTDKSQWITGDEQIDSILSEHLEDGPKSERRQRAIKQLDPEFDNFSSSDNSSSNAGSDHESDNSEDDPKRLWCTCQMPHDGKFMINCDICKDWFHGHCVGVTKLMGDRFEKEGKEWFCHECNEQLRSGTPRCAIPTKLVKKEKKKGQKPSSGKRGRGRPRKSESSAKDGQVRVSQRNLRRSSIPIDSKHGINSNKLRRNLARPEVKTETFDEFEDSQRLKVLIKERKKEFFLKRHLAEQQKAARRSQLGLGGRGSLTANLNDSLDSLATSTNTPNMNNLPINIKSEHRERSKPNIVLQINTKKDSGAEQSTSRIVTTIVRSHKKSSHGHDNDGSLGDIFTAEPIQINKRMKSESESSQTTYTAGESAGSSKSRKRTLSNSQSGADVSNGDTETTKKKRKDIVPSNGSGPTGSKHIVQKIKESLENRKRQINDVEISDEKIEALAGHIEAQLNECFKEGSSKYLTKFRSLIFNLRDTKNQGLVKNVLSGEISPARLVRMSHDEMASHELAKWRERENKHSIELIKRDAQLAAQQVIVKKTHKGEEVISGPLNEPEDAEVSNSEQPTTPSKLAIKEAFFEIINPATPTTASTKSTPVALKNGTTSASPEGPSIAATESSPGVSEQTEPTKSAENPIFLKESVEPLLSEPAAINDQESKTNEPQPKEQPKRFRVSIETKLDPADLTRLREPLVKPILAASPNHTESERCETPPPADESNEDEEYDPETATISVAPISSKKAQDPSRSSWSGSITMPDISKFNASAKSVAGSNVDFMEEEINRDLMVCGRIAPDQVQGYIKKLKATTKNQILLIQLYPTSPEDKQNYDTFFDYLYSRNRYGVIQTNPQSLKDFYVLPIHEKGSIPEFLKPSKGSTIDRKEPNCLLGLLVRSKRGPTSSTSSAR